MLPEPTNQSDYRPVSMGVPINHLLPGQGAQFAVNGVDGLQRGGRSLAEGRDSREDAVAKDGF
jgi:hypothetical protein